MKDRIRLHLIFDADVTLDGILLETRSEKILVFPDRESTWAHLYRERGEVYERLVPDGVVDTESLDIYVLKRH